MMEHFFENPSLFSLKCPMVKNVATGKSHNPGKSASIFVNFLLHPVTFTMKKNDKIIFGTNCNTNNEHITGSSRWNFCWHWKSNTQSLFTHLHIGVHGVGQSCYPTFKTIYLYPYPVPLLSRTRIVVFNNLTSKKYMFIWNNL